MKEELYEYFLSGYKYDKKNKDEFNYRFNIKYSIEKFNIEFNKFISMLDSFYYDNNKLVTAFNSYDIIIPKKIIRHIIKLYNYSVINNCEIQKNIISDFLLTYYNTIGINKKNNAKYKSVEEQFKKIMIEFKLSNFYKQLLLDNSSFYLITTKYGIENDMYISPEVVYRMLNNIKENINRNSIIEELLKNDKYLFIVINYDTELLKHKNYYLDFIRKILKQEHGYNDINDILGKLVCNTCLSNIEIKEIINLYIIKTNELCNKYKNKNEEFIGSLSEIESLKNNLMEVLNINSLADNYKEKIHECIINILSLKRYLLSDDKYINSGMHEFSTTTTISNDKIQQFIEELTNNKFRIYSASTLDFDKCVENAVEYYSKFALQSIVSLFSVDSKNQTYYTNEIFSTNYKYSFEKYYEKIGEEYTKNNNKKLLNKMSKGYYIEMLRDLSRTFNMHQNITISILGTEKFMQVIEELKKDLNYSSSNNYEIIVGNILAIEVNINKILTKNQMKYTDNMILNLDLLFNKYIDNKIARNGIMYLYYSLYEHSGPNLRNKAMHGTLIGEDLKIPLLISFSGLVFSSWLLNAK